MPRSVTNRIIVAALGTSTLLALGFWVARASHQPAVQAPENQAHPNPAASEPTRQTASPKPDIEPAWARALTRRIAELEQRLDALPTHDDDAVHSSTTGVEPRSPTVEERIARNQQRIQRIDRALDSEPRGGKWSHETTKVLEDLFATVVPTGSTLSTTTCGETFCRLVVQHESQEARHGFEIFPRKVPGMGVRGLIEHNDDGTEQTILYVVRKEYDTPEHPVRQQDQG